MAPGGDSGSEDEDIWGMLAGCADEDASPKAGEQCAVCDGTGRLLADECPHCDGAGRFLFSPDTTGRHAHEDGSPGSFGAASPSARAHELPDCATQVAGGASGSTARVIPAAQAAPADVQVDPSAFFWDPRRRGARGVPAEILDNVQLNEVCAALMPTTHDFEIHRTIFKLQRNGARNVGLQMPEGLQRWATAVGDILQQFVPTVESITILADVTFGACCIDDLACSALGVDYLVHYGHSCIVPTDQTTVTMLYVHVEVQIDVDHLVETVKLNMDASKRFAFMGTVQFTSGINQAVDALRRDFLTENGSGRVPQVKPLHAGEVLGCTSPVLGDTDAVIFVCDGRFHLESAMIQNPHIGDHFFRYDPYAKTLTHEGFAYNELHSGARGRIESAKSATLVGLILGTLGRQGSSGVLEEVERLLEKKDLAHFTVLLSEVSPQRLSLFRGVDAWVQVACPRLSMDWGEAYTVPMLTPYEAHVAFGDTAYRDVYPMDYYSNKGGPWSNYGTHNGYGGSLTKKFQHLGKRRRQVAYEAEDGAGT